MSKKTFLISLIILIVGLLTIFIYYRQSLPKKTTLVAYEDISVTSEEGCAFNSCCTFSCYNIGEPIDLCIACGNIPKHLTKGNNRCIKNSEGQCVLEVSLKSKFYSFWYKILNL